MELNLKNLVMVVIAFMSLVSSVYSETKVDASVVIGYEIVLKDGRSIKTETCWEDGDKILYQKYGSTIGFSKSKIKEVKEIMSTPDSKTMQNNSAMTQSTTILGCDRYDCPMNGRCDARTYTSEEAKIEIAYWEKVLAGKERNLLKSCKPHEQKDGFNICSIWAVEIKNRKHTLECLRQIVNYKN